MQNYKIVIDTSVWISVIRNIQFAELTKIIRRKQITVFVCGELMDELFDVLLRPKHYKKFNIQIDEFFNHINLITTTLSIKQNRDFKDWHDENDNFLFDLAIQSQADYLVTDDNDVLATPINPPTKIISFTEFREMFF